MGVATIVRAFQLESLVDEPELDVGVSLLPAGELPCRLRNAELSNRLSSPRPTIMVE